MADYTPVENNYPKYPQVPRTAIAVTTAANTTLSDTPNGTVLLLTAGAKGTEVTGLSLTPRATVVSAAVAYLYLSKDGGATQRMIRGVPVPSDTVSTTDAPSLIDFGYNNAGPLRLESGDSLYVGVSVVLTAGFAFLTQARDL